MNFWVQPYDPYDEAIQRFQQFNETPESEREFTEEELIKLVANKIKNAD